jgi:glycerophosphoryl diester phosphodiesterase
MTAFVLITGANPNPPGTDVAEFNGEFVTLQNLAGSALDVGGWFVRDAAGSPLVVPYGTKIAPHGQLRIYTGPGVETPGSVYCNRRRALLNNTGDTLRLFDRRGTLLQTFTYGAT